MITVALVASVLAVAAGTRRSVVIWCRLTWHKSAEEILDRLAGSCRSLNK